MMLPNTSALRKKWRPILKQALMKLLATQRWFYAVPNYNDTAICWAHFALPNLQTFLGYTTKPSFNTIVRSA